jgi:lysophospholipase L1-like esterase
LNQENPLMPKFHFSVAVLSALFVFAGAASPAQTVPQPQWVGTWAASPMLADSGYNLRPMSGATLREIVHISAGGSRIRVRFTNEFGTDPLTVADAHVALSAGGAAIQAGSDHAITFGGESSFRIPPGAAVDSDAVEMAVAPLSNLAVSFYLPPQVLRAETFHAFADQDNYYLQGDSAAAQDLPKADSFASWYFLDGVDVAAAPGARLVVAFGDSITDGAASTRNANRRWPDVLAARLSADANLKQVSVVDEGIGGNRVLNEGYGPSALSRFDRDVLAQDGVRYVIVLESINDIGHTARLSAPWDEIDAAQLEFGLKQLADAAHTHGIKIFGATLTPYLGAGYAAAKGEQMREAVNEWIRSSGVFDGVVDFDKIVRDPENPTRFNPAYDSGDHLHPSDAGYKAMGEGIDLTLFAK